MIRRIVAVVTLAAAVLLAPAPARAEQMTWTGSSGPCEGCGSGCDTGDGSSFCDLFNWCRQLPPPNCCYDKDPCDWCAAAMPGPDDEAIFQSLGGSITFGCNLTNSGLHVRNTAVAFNLSGNTYTLTSIDSLSVLVGHIKGNTASLTISSGTIAGVQAVIGGIQPGVTGTVTVGSGATWTNSSHLEVGEAGSGTLVIQAGGRVESQDGQIASRPGSTGDVRVDGPSSNWNLMTELEVGKVGALSAELHIQNGGSVTIASDSLQPDPGLHLGTKSPGALWVSHQGRVDVQSGDYEQGHEGYLVVELSDSSLPAITVADQAHLAGTLDIRLAPGFVPYDGQTFAIILVDVEPPEVGRFGEFDELVGPCQFNVRYYADAVVVELRPSCAPGCDKINIECLNGSPEYDNRRPVGRLLVNGQPRCTAWLIGAPNFIMTNAHCLPGEPELADLAVEFDYECDACLGGTCKPTVRYPVHSIMNIQSPLDFAVLRLDGDPADYWGTLSVDGSDPALDEAVYVIHHAGGWVKGFDQGNVTHTNPPPVDDCTQQQQIKVSVVAGKGASGSPIFRQSNHCVMSMAYCGQECTDNRYALPMAAILPYALPPIIAAGGSVTLGNCPWDLDGNTSVGIVDFLIMLALWGTDPGGPPDFDGDGNVGITDFLVLLSQWGPCP